MTAVAVLTQEQLEALLDAKLEPLRRELAGLRASREEEYFTLDEAAARLKMSRRTLQRRIKAGTIQAVRDGGLTRVVLRPAPEPDEDALAARRARAG